MRITFLLPRYGWIPSGGFLVVYGYANLLVRRGHDVTVVHPRRLPRGGWPSPRGLYARVHYGAGRVRDLVARPSLAWASLDPRVRRWYVPDLGARHVPDADAVIATWWSTAEASLAFPPAKGARFHLIQGYETWNGAEERVHAVLRAPIRKIVIARWLLERMLELGASGSLLTLIPNAVDHGTFRVLRPIGNRPPRVAMLYSSEPYKGGDLGLEILRRVKERVPELTAVLFGVRAAPRALPSWISYVRRASAAQLAGEIYNASSVYLCASLSEGWHLPATEAMACGCALLSSDIGGVRDYARDGETARLFAPGDVAGGAERLAELLHDAAGRAALARRGSASIDELSWDRNTDLLLGLLEESVSAASSW